MAEDTFVAFGATYDSVDDATTDFEAVRAAHQDLGLMDFYDAAVVAKDEDGTVRVVKKHETAEWVDGGIGTAAGAGVGLLVAALPAVALTGGLVVGAAAAGGVIGAITGHVTRGISRGDLKEVGEVLQEGNAGLIVLAGVDAEKRVDEAISASDRIVKKELKLDRKELDRELKEIEAQAGASDS